MIGIEFIEKVSKNMQEHSNITSRIKSIWVIMCIDIIFEYLTNKLNKYEVFKNRGIYWMNKFNRRIKKV